MPSQPVPFDLTGPLPTGTCVLEASAGTGKTYAITALAVRYLAEGHFTLDQVMMVTFSRAATSELRHRVHQRLRGTVAALQAFLDGGSLPDDPVDRHLAEAPREEVGLRLRRVRDALADIDAATIATTHEFCARMLTGLGLLVDHDHTARFAEDVSDLATQVVEDVYLAHEVNADPAQPGRMATFARYAEVGREALRESQAALVPHEPTGLSADRVAFAHQVRERFAQRKRRAGVYTFDDMVVRLRDALADEVTGDQAVEALSTRYPLVLIDEFQDTDPTQWQIVRRAFVGHSTVVLIGDPKQAIYAFRGADVHSYLDAVSSAGQLFTLPTNHRSDAGVVHGVLEVFGGASLGSGRIVPHPVQAAHATPRLQPPSGRGGAAVQVRCLPGPARGEHGASAAARLVDDDLVALVVQMLQEGWQVEAPRRPGEPARWRDLQARDIAVLVRSNWRGAQVKQALEDAGVAAVFGGAATVMSSEAASAWLHLLRALVDPSTQAMKRAALGCLLGWDEPELARAVADDTTPGSASGRQLADLAVQVKTLGRILAQQGVAAVFEALCDQTDLYRRLLARPDGERVMTDVRHVSQLLNEQAQRRRLGPHALVQWLEERIAEARRSQDDDRTRRLETDASCVQVMTIHGAKGLEFPVVLLPEAANEAPREPRPGTPSVLHLDGQRVLDVGVDAQWQQRQELRMAQERAESLRTLYVAMTRAKSRLVMWWAPTRTNTQGSPLHRLLHGARIPGQDPDLDVALPQDPCHVAGLDTSLVELVRVGQAAPRALHRAPRRHAALQARRLDRTVDTTWRRTSYSGLTADVHAQPSTAGPAALLREADEVEVADDPVVHVLRDDADAPGGPAAGPGLPGAERAAPATDPDEVPVSRLAPLPGGTQFGSLVHGVLEMVDTTADDLTAEVARHAAHLAPRLPVPGLDEQALVDGLVQVLHTPLGPVADGVSLAQVQPSDRLAELDFELSMGHGRAGRAASLGDLAAALQDDGLTGTDPFAARYGAHLQDSGIADKTLNGFLTGSIDAVLRTRDAQHEEHFWVVDYKTNRVPVAEGEELGCLHYTPEAMSRAMVEAHYPLQALLYQVALHRFLSWRLPGYRSTTHLGGIGYLFVRGMAGPATPFVGGAPCGVFSWQPSASLVEACSEILGGQ